MVNMHAHEIHWDYFLVGTESPGEVRFVSTHWPPILKSDTPIQFTPFPSAAYRFLDDQSVTSFLKSNPTDAEGRRLVPYLYETTTRRTYL